MQVVWALRFRWEAGLARHGTRPRVARAVVVVVVEVLLGGPEEASPLSPPYPPGLVLACSQHLAASTKCRSFSFGLTQEHRTRGGPFIRLWGPGTRKWTLHFKVLVQWYIALLLYIGLV